MNGWADLFTLGFWFVPVIFSIFIVLLMFIFRLITNPRHLTKYATKEILEDRKNEGN